MMNLGERVKKLRKSLGLTQKQFASRVPGKIDYTYIGKIERGHQYPSLKLLEKIGETFSLPLSYFFEDSERPGLRRVEEMAERVKVIACLISHYAWDTGFFRSCAECKLNAMELCCKIEKTVKKG